MSLFPIRSVTFQQVVDAIAGALANLVSSSHTWTAVQFFTSSFAANGTNNTAPNQTASGSTSLMTRGLGDARWQKTPIILELASDLTCASNISTVSSSTITLPAGTYDFFGVIFATTDSATAGLTVGSEKPTGTGPGTDSFQHYFRGSTPNAAFGTSVVERVGNNLVNTPYMFTAAEGEKTIFGTVAGRMVVTTQSTYAFQISQRFATDGANPARLKAGTYMRFDPR